MYVRAVVSQSPKRKLTEHTNMDVMIFTSGFNVDQNIHTKRITKALPTSLRVTVFNTVT